MSSSRTLSPSWIYQPPWAAAANPKHDFSCPLRKMCRALARVLAPPPSTLGLLVSLALGSVFPGLFLDWLRFPSWCFGGFVFVGVIMSLMVDLCIARDFQICSSCICFVCFGVFAVLSLIICPDGDVLVFMEAAAAVLWRLVVVLPSVGSGFMPILYPDFMSVWALALCQLWALALCQLWTLCMFEFFCSGLLLLHLFGLIFMSFTIL
ncbi:hypothetical protein ACE6H2_002344 [Prunus campanulata]